jgi:hypothetical protein
VRHNLELGGITLPRAELPGRIEEALARFPRIRERIDNQASTMSGGEQKQLEIGRALLLRPRVLLIDEPSIGLSPKLVQDVMGLCADWRMRGRRCSWSSRTCAPLSSMRTARSCSKWGGWRSIGLRRSSCTIRTSIAFSWAGTSPRRRRPTRDGPRRERERQDDKNGDSMNEAFICDAVRTPIGRYGGALATVRTDDLAALPIARWSSATRPSTGAPSTT